jgi:hypothetical protein
METLIASACQADPRGNPTVSHTHAIWGIRRASIRKKDKLVDSLVPGNIYQEAPLCASIMIVMHMSYMCIAHG